uniref:Protein kinase domain-containing protein n=3 Tax=Scophthalmus maximus TaxID=52904 RepID=A0A8D3AAA0_SCOMX
MSRTTAPGWEVYTSPEQPPRPATQISQKPESEPFEILEDLDKPAIPERAQEPAFDVPMSPECALKPDWMANRIPEVTVEPDLDAFLSPLRPKRADTVPTMTPDVPMSPEQPQLCADVPMSPMQQAPPWFSSVDDPMSPDRGATPSADVSMNTTTPRTSRTGAVQLVSDPWDSDLIWDLLWTLSPPLTSHPRCISWKCNLPNITPKMTISMGKESLRVDCVLGEGAFATVYQATDPTTSERMVLKVQKPANPWEFYIHTRLDARLQPDVRRLYSSIHAAHLFHNGSVLLGELHNYGTLLNAVNTYKGLSDKLMPQPLVMYFTVCILHMVEQLHAVHVVHADIKPDNFLLGERFLENRCFDPENVDHGLVLIDLGQSIDMELFPEGTAFTAKCLTSGFQCTEMLSGKPWNYQTDYFGIAGTVFCLLFGTYMQVTNEGGVWRTNAVFRRNPHSDLWLDFFHTLLNVPDCSSLPSLRRLRGELTSVLQQNYGSKLSTLKSRLVVLLLESRKAARR